MNRSALGICTHLGWATVVAVLVARDEIARVRSFRLQTCDGQDREAMEPYHVAGGFEGLRRVPPPSRPEKVIASGLGRQRRRTASNLGRVVRELGEWPSTLRRAALFVGRGRPAASLERILASHAQIHVAEGNAVRDSFRHACGALDLRVVELERRSLLAEAQERLALDDRTLTARLRAARPENGGAWRKEERDCALAAWIATTQRTR